jgi:hypothetical protein
VAFIDGRGCSVAAVRRGARLAAARRQPLEVVFLRTHPSPLLAASPIGMAAIGPAVELEDQLEIERFGGVAKILAPYGLSWTYVALPYHAAGSAAGARHTLVVARHSRRPVADRLLAAVRAAGCPVHTLVVGCDHRPDGSAAATPNPVSPGGPR